MGSTSYPRAVLLAGLATCLLLVLAPLALAEAPGHIEPTGTDLWSNVAPADLGGRAEQYPASAWELDYPFPALTADAGLLEGVDIDASGIIPKALHTIANTLWEAHVYLTKGVLTVFSWAFGVDLLDDRYGILAPVAQVTTDLYDALGTWVTLAVLGLGGVLTWRLFMRRDVGGTVGQLVSAIAATAIALLIINNPAWTAQFASGIARTTASGLLGVTNERTPGESDDPRVRATDALWQTLVADPWLVLQFGGLEHCVNAQGNPVPPESDGCRRGGTRIDHRQKYADAFLTAGTANNGTRTALYEAIATGETPDDERLEELQELQANKEQVRALQVSEADKPAGDIMSKSGAEDRLAITPFILVGGLGANLMVGLMAATQIIMQVWFLLLLSLSAIMLLAAMIPGRCQAAFVAWLARLFGALFKVVVIALILGVAVAIAAALTSAGAQVGWLFTFVAQAMFWWAVFFYRRELMAIVSAGAPASAGLQHSREDDAGLGGLTKAYILSKGVRHHMRRRSEHRWDDTMRSGAYEGGTAGGLVGGHLGASAPGRGRDPDDDPPPPQPGSAGAGTGADDPPPPSPAAVPPPAPGLQPVDRSIDNGTPAGPVAVPPPAPGLQPVDRSIDNGTPAGPVAGGLSGAPGPAGTPGPPPDAATGNGAPAAGEGGSGGGAKPPEPSTAGGVSPSPGGEPSGRPRERTLATLDEDLARDRARMHGPREGPQDGGNGASGEQGPQRPDRDGGGPRPGSAPSPEDLEPPRTEEDQ